MRRHSTLAGCHPRQGSIREHAAGQWPSTRLCQRSPDRCSSSLQPPRYPQCSAGSAGSRARPSELAPPFVYTHSARPCLPHLAGLNDVLEQAAQQALLILDLLQAPAGSRATGGGKRLAGRCHGCRVSTGNDRVASGLAGSAGQRCSTLGQRRGRACGGKVEMQAVRQAGFSAGGTLAHIGATQQLDRACR